MVILSPVGLAAAPVNNQVSLLATYKEKLCHRVCTTSSNKPIATVTYAKGQPELNGTTVFVPITATVTIITPGCSPNGCNSLPQVINEKFYVAFQSQTGIPTDVQITSAGTIQDFYKKQCGWSCNYAILDSLTVTITPPAAAAAG